MIGSECTNLGRLGFPRILAERLYEALTNPEIGGCTGALKETESLLVDPTAEELNAQIWTAVTRASEDSATLFLAFVGHGRAIGEQFFLLADTTTDPPNSHSAFSMNVLTELINQYRGMLDGLVFLVDACEAGGAIRRARDWIEPLLQGGGRFEILTASDDEDAAHGCFTKQIVAMLTEGVDEAGDRLRCGDLKDGLLERCPHQVAEHLSWDGRRVVSDRGVDRGLWLAPNRRRRPGTAALAGRIAYGQLERLTRDYVDTGAQEEVLERSAQRCVAIVGHAGTGKSALLAALARPEFGLAPASFVNAFAFASAATSATALPAELADQLRKMVPSFEGAATVYLDSLTLSELDILDPFELHLAGPLRQFFSGAGANVRVRIVVDGLDQLTTESASGVRAGLERLASDPTLGGVRVVVSSRPDTALPAGADVVTLTGPSRETLLAYLERRDVPAGRLRDEIATVANGNWQQAALLADLASDAIAAATVPTSLRDAYDVAVQSVLRQAEWAPAVSAVLTVLAAAGTGPVLPLVLLGAAAAELGGGAHAVHLRDVLVALGEPLVVRGQAGTEAEAVGCAHPSFETYIAGDDGARLDVTAGHRALADSVARLADPSRGPDDRISRYARDNEARHRWHAGDLDGALESLENWELPRPAENLERWRGWLDTVTEEGGPDGVRSLRARGDLAAAVGKVGRRRDALVALEQLLPRQAAVLGPHHRDTLRSRSDIASWTGLCGNPATALRICTELLPDQERLLGPDDEDTLTTRGNIAYWTGETGDGKGALRLFRELQADRERVLGTEHHDTLITKNNVASWTGLNGDEREALRLSRELLTIRLRILGADHPATLITRNNVAAFTARLGRRREAVRLLGELLVDQERVLGADHPDVLTTRANLAVWIGELDDPDNALDRLRNVLADRERLLGPDHPDTLATRLNVAYFTAKRGDKARALHLYEALLTDQERVLTDRHPDSLLTRRRIAALRGDG